MSTNSLIGIRENGYIRGIYCHWDGYPEYVGAILNAHYTSISKIKKLIALGSLSSLGERVEPKKGELHTFDKPQNGVTIAYHRDRGEKLQRAVRVKDTEMEKLNWGEYAYIFDVKKKEWLTLKCVGVSEDYTKRRWMIQVVNYEMLIDKAIKEMYMTPPRGWKKK